MKIIKFYKTGEEYGFFSNFASYPIYIDFEIWNTVEHYFQANKFDDLEIRKKIKNCSSPIKAAELGRNRKFNLVSNWEQKRDEVMYKALRAKFLQHTDLKRELLLTGDSVLIEHTFIDSYWADGGDGSGQNKLGVLLMLLRTEIMNVSRDPDVIFPPWIAFPTIDQNDMFWRMGLGEQYLSEWAKYFLSTNKEKYKLEFPETDGWRDIYQL